MSRNPSSKKPPRKRPLSKEEKKELWEFRNNVGRTVFYGKNHVVVDASRRDVAQLLRENYDQSRELWKQDYRQRKALRSEYSTEITGALFKQLLVVP
jgi:hypothetical protein